MRTPSLMDAFNQGQTEWTKQWEAIPIRLRGRAKWLQEIGRIKDSELMCDAATEIENLRKQVKTTT